MSPFEYRLTVTPESLDDNGHANNVEYVRWMQAAAIAHADAAGCTEATMADGASWFVRSHHIEYLRPALSGDEIVVQTWVADMRRVASLRRYRMVRASDCELIAQGETDWVYVDSTSGRPRSIPVSVSNAFAIGAPAQ